MKHPDPCHGMIDLLHGDPHGDAESWLRNLIMRRFAPRGHREHGSLGHHRRHLPRVGGHGAGNAQDGRSV